MAGTTSAATTGLGLSGRDKIQAIYLLRNRCKTQVECLFFCKAYSENLS
jgi:hypothetical protein